MRYSAVGWGTVIGGKISGFGITVVDGDSKDLQYFEPQNSSKNLRGVPSIAANARNPLVYLRSGTASWLVLTDDAINEVVLASPP
jgi:hypothetical protein